MQNKVEEAMHAGFFVRLAAYLLDSLIVGAALLVVRIPFWISSWINPENLLVRDFIFSYSVADIVLYILGALYFVLLTYKTGATIGKKVMHIHVESAEKRPLTLWEVCYRETVGRFLSALIANVGYLMIGIHSEKRGLHDLLSDTIVVYDHLKTEVVKENVSADGTYQTPSYVQAVFEEAEVENAEPEEMPVQMIEEPIEQNVEEALEQIIEE